MKRLLNFSSLAVICVLGLASTTSAQITWEPSVNLFQGETVQTFVDTTGVGLVASNLTLDLTQEATLNGVVFTTAGNGTAVGGTGTETITVNGGTDNATAFGDGEFTADIETVSYTHLRAHETLRYLVCRLLLEKKK